MADWSGRQVRREIEAALGNWTTWRSWFTSRRRPIRMLPSETACRRLLPPRARSPNWCGGIPSLGLDCSNLKFRNWLGSCYREIVKRRLRDILKLRYSANKYGPYADNLRHLLNGLDGSYLHCEKRLSDAGPLI